MPDMDCKNIKTSLDFYNPYQATDILKIKIRSSFFMLYWHLSSLVVFNIKKLQIKKNKQILKTCFKTVNSLYSLKPSLKPKGQVLKKRPYPILAEQCSNNKTIHNKILTIKFQLNKTNFYYFYYWNFVTLFLPESRSSSTNQRGGPTSQRYEISKNPKLLDIHSLRTTACMDSKNLNQSVTRVSCLNLVQVQPMIKKLENSNSNQSRIKFQMIFLIRPLLTVSRSETKILSNFWNLPIFPDRTNLQLKYRRNRIRYQLLPTLKILFNPKMDCVLLEFSEITNKENRYFDFFSKKIIKNC